MTNSFMGQETPTSLHFRRLRLGKVGWESAAVRGNLYGWHAVHDIHPGGGEEGEVAVGGGHVFVDAGEGELGHGAVRFFQSDALDDAVGGDGQAERLDALSHLL